MLSLYEILKASKTGIAPDMWTALAGKNWGGADSGHEVKELTGIPPLNFTANGQPLLDYLISGNMSQTGTPTPTTPIQPSECGERTGNLFDKNATNTTNGYVNGAYIINTGEETMGSSWIISEYIEISSDTTYALKYAMEAKINPSVAFYDSSKQLINATNYNNNLPYTFTTPSTAKYLRFSGLKADLNYIMLVKGSTPQPYEPYGYKIPISSASTTTPVYLGEIESTRRIKKLVLTGEEAIEIKSGNAKWYIPIADMKTPTNTGVIEWYCSHYQAVANNASWTSYDYMISWSTADSGSSIGLRIRDIDFLTGVTVDDFKAYLAAQYANGTPVTVWYVLATPETAVVNEPIRKIGNYADTLSMEQAGVQIPTNRGNTVIDVETTLKPSNVYIKYKGV